MDDHQSSNSEKRREATITGAANEILGATVCFRGKYILSSALQAGHHLRPAAKNILNRSP